MCLQFLWLCVFFQPLSSSLAYFGFSKQCDSVNRCCKQDWQSRNKLCSTVYVSQLPMEYGREGNGTPPQYSCLENPVDGGAWWAAVHGVAQSRTRLKRLRMHACTKHSVVKLSRAIGVDRFEDEVKRGAPT